MKIMSQRSKQYSMNFPAIGARLNQKNCSFNVWAPFRKKVEIIMVDTGATYPMLQADQGYWTLDLHQVDPHSRYLFRLDGEKELPDPASRAQCEGVHGPSFVVAENFEWKDNEWRGIPLGEMIIYEIHVGTFTARHDFRGVISKMPYLKELGVNTIELMPVAQFPGDRNWGYDGVFPFAVQHSYGGSQGLKELVNAAHLNGLAVILDVVYNHQGPEGNYLSEYGPYFTDKYKTGWGQAINYDDAWCDGVRNFYWQNAMMWLEDFHIDGLRLDAVHAIWDFSSIHFIEELRSRVKDLEQRSHRPKILIAEFDLNNPRYVQPVEMGGYGLDGQWIDEYHHALHSLLTGETNGYYEDFGHTNHLARALEDSYVYTGQYSTHRKKFFGRLPDGTSYHQFVVFAQNHDQVGNRMLGDRFGTLLSKEGLKLAAVAYLLSPHVPMLFMGEEYGERNPFQYFISHTDENLVALVRKGRKEEFSYFTWQGEVPDPQSEATFENCILSWEVERSSNAQEIFSIYKHLIEFRKKRPAMRGASRDTLRIVEVSDQVVAFERQFENDYVLIVLNFSNSPFDYRIPGQQELRLIFDSAQSRWGGPAEARHGPMSPGHLFHFYPQSALIFEQA